MTAEFPKRSADDASNEVVVSVRGLTKVFKDFWGRPKARAVDNVDFPVRRGEVVIRRARCRAVGEFFTCMQRRSGRWQALVMEADLVMPDGATAGLDPIASREGKHLLLAYAGHRNSVPLGRH